MTDNTRPPEALTEYPPCDIQTGRHTGTCALCQGSIASTPPPLPTFAEREEHLRQRAARLWNEDEDVAVCIAEIDRLASTPEPDLDVERLGVAMTNAAGVTWPKRWVASDFAWVARQVATEYTRLRDSNA